MKRKKPAAPEVLPQCRRLVTIGHAITGLAVMRAGRPGARSSSGIRRPWRRLPDGVNFRMALLSIGLDELRGYVRAYPPMVQAWAEALERLQSSRSVALWSPVATACIPTGDLACLHNSL